MNEMLPRWFVTVKLALPSPLTPLTRRPSLIKFILLPENAPSEILRVEGAVATNLNPALKGIRKLMLPRVEMKR